MTPHNKQDDISDRETAESLDASSGEAPAPLTVLVSALRKRLSKSQVETLLEWLSASPLDDLLVELRRCDRCGMRERTPECETGRCPLNLCSGEAPVSPAANFVQADLPQGEVTVYNPDAEDAARWRALLNSARVRGLGRAGPEYDTHYAHIGLELWTIHPGATDGENAIGRRWLTEYADAAVLLQRDSGRPTIGAQDSADVAPPQMSPAEYDCEDCHQRVHREHTASECADTLNAEVERLRAALARESAALTETLLAKKALAEAKDITWHAEHAEDLAMLTRIRDLFAARGSEEMADCDTDGCVIQLIADNDELRAALDVATRDATRMDWLESCDPHAYAMLAQGWKDGRRIRGMIDAASAPSPHPDAKDAD